MALRIASLLALGAVASSQLTAGGFVPYYTYTGDLAVSGTVGPMTTAGTTQTFYYQLDGVDTLCESGAGSAGNSCGIHIHAGRTCVDNALGHYYTGAVTTDPWTSIAYTATAAGTTSGSVTVDTGAASTTLEGLALIVHGYDGGRIACALLSDGVDSALQASAFVPYYTYTGSLAVSGVVGPMTTAGTTQTFSYTLVGADPACESGAGSAGNSCGIHIHTGTTCTDNALGHYYTGAVTTDPWTSVSYTSDSAGASSGSVTVDTGAGSGEVAGRAFIIHGYDGGRIGCAILGAATQVTLTADGFVPYYTYTGDLAVSGTVGPMTTAGTTQTFYYQLDGVDTLCESGAGSAGNSCGIHIHAGRTCVDNALGHYYTGAVTTDPWTSIAYTATAAGTTSGSVTVDTGAASTTLEGLALIVHGYDGGRIACALLSDGVDSALQASAFVPYYTYTGSLAVSGVVGPMTTAGTTQTFSYTLVGADPACESGAGSAGNSCGIHIHTGTTCTDNALGHYYTGAVTTDPWTSVSYTSDSAGASSGSVTVDTGAGSGEVAGRAFIIHGYDGGRIGCAILGAATQVTLTADGFVPYYTYTGDLAVSGTVGPMTTAGTTQTFYYQLDGVDTLCESGAGSAGNSCGIHIHAGRTCVDNALGHYYTGAVTTDPWTSIAYTATAAGTTSGSVTVDTGAASTTLEGLALIVHGYDGGRIACALLSDGVDSALQASAFVPYYTYTGSLAVSGVVGPMTTAGTTQTFSYTLVGADPACESGAGSAGNSCGIHIHTGTTCTDNALGHYYTGAVTTDPWTSVSYTSDSAGASSGSVTVDTGAGSGEVAGRAFIIHGYDGGRIGCAILGATVASPPSYPPSLPPPSPPVGASIMQDPHMDLAHDGHADFRGKHKSLYKYLSTPGLSVNVLIEEALYTLHDGKLLVNGTYMTEVHVAALVEGSSQCKWAYVSYVASQLNGQNWGWSNVKGSCGGNEFKLGPNANRGCGGLHARVKMSTATITVAPFEGSTEAAPWKIVVHGDHVHDRVAGPEHRLDIELSYSPQSSAPLIAHGLIGQSFADPLPRFGRLDVYPEEGTFTTSAQAEGAIEGTADIYEVSSPFETDFTFSLFAGEPSRKAGTADAAKATCDKKLADELSDLEQQGKVLAIRPWFQAIKRSFQRAVAPPSVVARAASIEVRPGEGLMEAHRRLAEAALPRAAQSILLSARA